METVFSKGVEMSVFRLECPQRNGNMQILEVESESLK